MKYLFRIFKILIISVLSAFIALLTVSYLLLNLEPVQRQIVRVGEKELSALLDTRVTIGEGTIYPFNKVFLKDVCLYDKQGDTLLYAQELTAGFALQKLLRRRLVFTTIQLYDFQANLSRDDKQSPLNLQFIIDRFHKKEHSTIDIHSQINTILVRRGSITYDVRSEPCRRASVFDPNHIGIENFLATVSLKSLERDSVNVNIRKIAFDEKSGFSLQKFGVKLVGNSNRLMISNFRISLPHSELSLNRMTTDALSYGSFEEFCRQSLLDLKMQRALVTLSDFKAFVPRLKDANTPLKISTSLDGTLDSLRLGQLEVQYGDGYLFLSAEALARHLFVRDSMEISGAVDELYATEKALPLIVSELLPGREALVKRAESVGAWNFYGEVSRNVAGIQADGILSCELGTLAGDVNMTVDDDDIFTLVGQLSTTDFAIGKFFAVESMMGNIGLDIRLNLNQHLAGGELWGNVEGDISHFDFKNYTYRNISLRGNYNNTYYNGFMAIDDPNGRFQLTGAIDLFNELPVIKVVAKGRDIHFDRLNLLPRYTGSVMQFDLSSNLVGSNIDNIEGTVLIDSLRFENDGHSFSTENFSVLAENRDSLRTLRIDSDIINGEVEGKYAFKQLKKQITSFLTEFLPALFPASEPAADEAETDFRYAFEIEETSKLSDAFDLPVRFSERAALSGFFDGRNRDMELYVNAPEVVVSNRILHDNEVRLRKVDTTLQFSAYTATYNKQNKYIGLAVNAQAADNNVLTRLNWSNNGTSTLCGEMAASTRIETVARKTRYNIDLLPTQIIIGDSVWHVAPATISVHDGKGFVDDFSISHRKQFLHLDGFVATAGQDSLHLSLNDINLAYIFETLNLKNVVFGGQATGDFVIADLLNGGMPRLSTQDFRVEDFSYNYAPFGDLRLNSHWDNDNKGIFLDGIVTQPQYPDTRVSGYIFPTRDSLNLHFDAQHISLAFLNPFTEKILQDVSGHASGSIDFYGRFKALNINGAVRVERFGFGIDYLNTRFYISDSVRLTPDGIFMDNMTMTDVEGHTGRVNGEMRHRNFKNIEYLLTATNMRNMLVYNTTEKQSPVYYGKVYGSGNVTVEGDMQHTDIDINVSTEDHSKFTFVLSNTSEAGEYGFITFVDRSRSSRAMKRDTLSFPLSVPEPEPLRHSLSLNLQIDATPQIAMNLLMDPATGDMIQASGSGNIRIEYDTFSDMKLYGTYTVEKGNYNFSLQDLITRDFNIVNGSSITFAGAPLDADLNIEAYYALTANLEDLDESFATEQELNRTTIPVRAMLYLTGELQQPDFRFDLAFPTVTQDIDRRIRSIISTDDMINRQIIYLLALNKFYTPDYMNVGQTRNNELASVASSALSSQLNNMLGQINENINIGTNLRSDKGDFSDVEVELALSSQLLNNRLILNGNIGYRDNAVNNNTFVGDFDLEYLLTKSGNIRLKAYNHYNDKNYYVKSALTTQGVGIMYRKEFNRWREWFSWLKRRKKNKTANP